MEKRKEVENRPRLCHRDAMVFARNWKGKTIPGLDKGKGVKFL